MPPREGNDDEEMEFQNAKRAIKVIYGHSDSESSGNERRNQLHVICNGSWDIMSKCVVRTLRRAVAAASPAP
jgi:hypothetical protein